ncbi:hypothetical protein BJ875DRAFT_476738 [Amylocarpus encephaloides]|uniref:Uncharacterized protein n=1 Tax=Amylocarpus encephaloides TaxID=45428 RepID=A0A9P7Y8U0_9HELO|nr:hypothetical protein BJ875DRAFT_476738 [Amylocarpus encephaloides]
MDTSAANRVRSFEQALTNRVAQNVNRSGPWLPPPIDGQNLFAQFCATNGHRTNNPEQDLRNDISGFIYTNNFGDPARIRIVDLHGFTPKVELMVDAEIANFEFAFMHPNGSFGSFRKPLRSYFQGRDHRVDELLSVNFAVRAARWRALLMTFHNGLQSEARREFQQVRDQLAEEDRNELYGFHRRDHVLDRVMGQWVPVRNRNINEAVYQAAVALHALREAQHTATQAVERIPPLQPRSIAPGNQAPRDAAKNNSLESTGNGLNVAGSSHNRPVAPVPAPDRPGRPTESPGPPTNRNIENPSEGYLPSARGNSCGTQHGRTTLLATPFPRHQGLGSNMPTPQAPLGHNARQPARPPTKIVPPPRTPSNIPRKGGLVCTPNSQPAREDARATPCMSRAPSTSQVSGATPKQSGMVRLNLPTYANPKQARIPLPPYPLPKQPRPETPNMVSCADPSQGPSKPLVESRTPQLAFVDRVSMDSDKHVASAKFVKIGPHSVPMTVFQAKFKAMCGDVARDHAVGVTQRGGPSSADTVEVSSVVASASSIEMSELLSYGDPNQASPRAAADEPGASSQTIQDSSEESDEDDEDEEDDAGGQDATPYRKRPGSFSDLGRNPKQQRILESLDTESEESGDNETVAADLDEDGDATVE